ncbi:Retrovirus-related Pol polyprotein from transposon RE1 [Linum grandiflorum]
MCSHVGSSNKLLDKGYIIARTTPFYLRCTVRQFGLVVSLLVDRTRGISCDSTNPRFAWRTKKQQVVVWSSAEAEYRAMATIVSEFIWLIRLLGGLGVNTIAGTQLHCDNQAALHIASNPIFHERTKHVGMDCHFVRERIASKEIQPQKISTKNQIAVFTKALGQDRLHYSLSKLSVHDIHALA